ncbi:MAG: DEAD/DEAH box helicase, partial [Ilumatobacteraceae bacterium]
MSPTTDDVVGALRAVAGGLAACEHRPGQERMAGEIARSIDTHRHLVVQAGTGTGKTLAYLVPAALSGRRVVVATATKALQDQLATKDLPFVAEQLALHTGRDPFTWAVLKGRSNYVCLQRLHELTAGEQGQLELDDLGSSIRAEVVRLDQWAKTSPT